MLLLHKSLKLKILAALILVFALLMIATSMITSHNERAMVMNLATDKTMQMAYSYFDNVNTLMLSGGMAQRHILRDKLLESEGIIDAKLIRADAVKQLFGPGNPEQVVRDELDERGLEAREPIIQTGQNDSGRTVSVIIPLRASDKFRRVYCLSANMLTPPPRMPNTLQNKAAISLNLRKRSISKSTNSRCKTRLAGGTSPLFANHVRAPIKAFAIVKIEFTHDLAEMIHLV